ncbi:MAG: hypothetical protein WAU88_08295 [Candidatus Zixiibacteriota bacterium]
MKNQTRYKIHQAIEYIKQDHEFPFDTHDDFRDILAHYGITITLNHDDEPVLREELRRMAEDAQTAEIARQIVRQLTWG